MQLQGHPESWDNNFVQQVDVRKHPLVSGCYPEVTFEEGVEAVQERIQAAKQSLFVHMAQRCSGPCHPELARVSPMKPQGLYCL